MDCSQFSSILPNTILNRSQHCNIFISGIWNWNIEIWDFSGEYEVISEPCVFDELNILPKPSQLNDFSSKYIDIIACGTRYLFFRLIRFCVFKLDLDAIWMNAHWSYRFATVLSNCTTVEMRHVSFLLLCINNKWNEPYNSLHQTAILYPAKRLSLVRSG